MHEIRIDKGVYSKDVLLKTAFTFTDRVYLHLGQDENCWIVSWMTKDGNEVDPGNFENELVAQQLRAGLIEKTADIRKLILARAFASTILDEGNITFQNETQSRSFITEPASLTDDNESILKGWFDQNA